MFRNCLRFHSGDTTGTHKGEGEKGGAATTPRGKISRSQVTSHPRLASWPEPPTSGWRGAGGQELNSTRVGIEREVSCCAA